MRRAKSIILNIGVLLLTLCIMAGAAELAIRLLKPNIVMLRLLHKADASLGFRLVPRYEMLYNTSEFTTRIAINSEGLRDCEYSAARDKRTFRILAIGDSFTFGIGVAGDQAYPKVLERMLNNAPLGTDPAAYEVVNAGVDAYGTEQEYRYLKELLARYQPDLVIVGLYSNDVWDVMTGIQAPASIARQQSYLLEYLGGLKTLARPIFKRNMGSALLAIYQDHYSPEFEQALQKTKDCLIKIRDAAKSEGAQTLIVIIPLCLEVGRHEWDKKGFGRFYTQDFFNNNMARFSDTFVEFGRQEDIPTVPLLPIMRMNAHKMLYYEHDVHWTKEGNQLAAETLYAYLRAWNPPKKAVIR
jgi:lysophospholipase L1-like esterase